MAGATSHCRYGGIRHLACAGRGLTVACILLSSAGPRVSKLTQGPPKSTEQGVSPAPKLFGQEERLSMSHLPLIVPVLSAGLLLAGCNSSREHDHSKHDHGAVSAQPEAAPRQHPAPGATPPTAPATGVIVNTKCPMMGEDIDPTLTVNYKGMRVAFCCKDCIPDWEKLSEAEKDAKLRQ